MASIGQRCPLCGDSLLKFLFNTNGDYIVNCSSRVCLYGVLHAEVYRADEQPTALEASIITASAAPSTFQHGADALDEVSNQVDLFSTFGPTDENSAFDMIDSAAAAAAAPTTETTKVAAAAAATTTTTAEANAQMSDTFPASFDLSRTDNGFVIGDSGAGGGGGNNEDDDMINQWVRELMGPSADVGPATPLYAPLSPADVVNEPLPLVEAARPVKSVARGRQSTAKKLAPVPMSSRPAKLATKSLAVPKLEPRLSRAKQTAEKGPLKLLGRPQKAQAIASLLKSHLGAGASASASASDDVPSEASSDSGIQSDASSDRSCSSTSLTPIQRLLHIEEAKKRSWGVTGMPGFKPSATKGRRRQPVVY